MGSTGRCNTVGFKVLSGSEVHEWRDWVVQKVLSAAGKKELWERWRSGEPISDIARALRKAPGSIHGMVEATGGFSPPQRRRRSDALTPAEREEISRGLATGDSLRAIARRLGRSASTVCREVERPGGRVRYRAAEAEERSWERARRPKRCLLAINDGLREVVAEKLKENWSPWRGLSWPTAPRAWTSNGKWRSR